MIKTYLGDSVYAVFDGSSITLTTDNGYGPSNIIVLEEEVLRALEIFVTGIKSGAVKAGGR